MSSLHQLNLMSLKKPRQFGSACLPIFLLEASVNNALPGHLLLIYTARRSLSDMGVVLFPIIFITVLATINRVLSQVVGARNLYCGR